MNKQFTDKQRNFINEYPKDFNATQAAIRAGYSPRTAYIIGFENLRKPKIRAEIDRILEERVMSRNEVLARLANQANADIRDFIDILPGGRQVLLNIEKAAQAGKTHLIKKLKITKGGPEIELYDAQSALVHLGRHYKLFTDKLELVGWQRELLDLLNNGTITPEDIESELGSDIAKEFFESAGIAVAGIGAAAEESAEAAGGSVA